MNETKKWLKSLVESDRVSADKATAELFFLDSIQMMGETSRRTTIVRMPKYIREYESEYHYLFYLVLRFVSKKDDPINYFYILPNALRKVLDVFLAFKLPESRGLGSKIESVAKSWSNKIDPTRMVALERLVQLESHAENLDDLVSFSSMTIEETMDAALALLELMKVLDSDHYDVLCKICRPAI